MRRSFLTLALALAAGLVALWALGGLETLAGLARDSQRAAQNAMAGTLRALRGGEAGALAALLGLAFGYGVAHAAGPGHGKLLIGGYGVATQVPAGRLAAIALASGLAQATTAVVLVHGGIALFDWTRADLVGLGEGALAQAGTVAIALIGLWLALRGARGLMRASAPAMAGGPPAVAPCCGHRHGPDPAEIAAAAGWRDAALLVGAVAIRPCTGALFLLILTWRMDIVAAGILATYAMGLGTALITAGVAVLGVSAREGAFLWFTRLRRLGPVLELGVGLLIALVAFQALRLGL